uniref:Ribosomal protein S7 n=1 Tax=Vermamoeba vermiformis TaxID=5778 RepID=A0A0K1HPA8_VERVE|nr:ribosomal protein S7 [Vermamoeba vermiformis]
MKVSKYFDKNYRSVVASAFTNRGLKTKSIKAYQDLLLSLKNYGIKEPEQFLKLRLLELQPIVNLRSVKLGGIKYKIPYLIKESNQLTFASIWLTRVKGLKKVNRFNLVKAITDNIYQLKDKKGAAYVKQQDWYSTASRNRPYLKYLRD